MKKDKFKNWKHENKRKKSIHYLDEKMLVLARIEFVPCVQRLDFDLPQIKQKIATITATTNIVPRIQKARASFDEDIHKMPSDGKWRNFAGYSSTESKNWFKKN